jgi:hypothetical protein
MRESFGARPCFRSTTGKHHGHYCIVMLHVFTAASLVHTNILYIFNIRVLASQPQSTDRDSQRSFLLTICRRKTVSHERRNSGALWKFSFQSPVTSHHHEMECIHSATEHARAIHLRRNSTAPLRPAISGKHAQTVHAHESLIVSPNVTCENEEQALKPSHLVGLFCLEVREPPKTTHPYIRMPLSPGGRINSLGGVSVFSISIQDARYDILTL